MVRDISLSGIGLVSPTPLRPGTFLAINLPGAKRLRRTVKAQVVRVVPKSRGTFVLGCRLSTNLSADELEGLR